MELYHIHRINKHGNYHEGQILYPGTEFNAMHEEFLNVAASLPVATKEINGQCINYMASLEKYLNKKIIRDNITPDELKQLLIFTRNYARNSSINAREMILEEVRKESYNNLPSRYKCMWLADEDSINYWLNRLYNKNGIEVFKVNANGNLFLSTDALLPDEYKPHKIMYEQAHKYWNPDSKYLETAKDKEYLFEGELKILKKVSK